ncbi:hypothetical protein SAQ01S_06850 [Sphingomonas aquatilis NBRC 16722]|uniref:Uncharacterized protein n=1 Tax=Sphingomonas aquatilis TaxID=93063 RepID=A0AAW3TSA8_9SPHN|nr:hypothetical protein [Sphingomonas aquatilis]MBB3876068.1 hypothetical protein [Sphingomonas aquatilis]GEM70919.1 hypothetical protein SAQ01S_06850 [Sphingomonas aquatilis NBRC 16722]
MTDLTREGLVEQIASLEKQLRDARRTSTDRLYMIGALVPMLGPKGRQVWEQWQAKGVQRIHTAWADDVMALAGEEVAERHLQINKACEEAVPIDNMDSRDPSARARAMEAGRG